MSRDINDLVNVAEGDLIRDRIFREIDGERIRQDQRWGRASERNLPLPVWLTVMVEEVGEVAHEILTGPLKQDDCISLRMELRQVAAVAVAMMEAIDAGSAPFGFSPEDAG